jgi:hypothetical protein
LLIALPAAGDRKLSDESFVMSCGELFGAGLSSVCE